MSTTTEMKQELDSLGIARNWQVTVEVDAERVLCISNQHYAGKSDLEPYEATIESCATHLLAFIGRSAAHGESKVPQFIVRDAERAIDAATNPKGMHTNGPAMARIEASRLAALLRYAQMNSSVPAQAIKRAAEMLEYDAEGLKAAHTICGKWHGENEAKADYDERKKIAKQLREMIAGAPRAA